MPMSSQIWHQDQVHFVCVSFYAHSLQSDVKRSDTVVSNYIWLLLIEISPRREIGNSNASKRGNSKNKSKDEEKLPLKDSLEKAETYSTSSTQSLEILKGIDLDVTTGQLVGVVGAVGCGKSSVLSAILNEVE